MNQIRRIAAMVESCSFLLLFFSNTDLESSCRDSCEPCLEVVSFASGDHPTAAPVCVFNSFLHDVWLKQLSQHNLPPLSTVNEVQNLAATPRDSYFAGYYPGEPLPPVADRISRILTAIGIEE